MKYISGWVLLLLMMLSVEVSGQSFGIKGGLNISNISASDENGDIGQFYDNRFGPMIGIDVQFFLSGELQFKTGIALSSKGAVADDNGSFQGISFSSEAELKSYYLDIPLNLQYTLLREQVGLYVFGGPMIGIGIAGTNSFKSTVDGVTEDDYSEDIRWGNSDDDDLRRLEIAARLGAGVDLKTIMVEVYYDLGLNNISAFTDFDTRLSNRVLGIALIYKL